MIALFSSKAEMSAAVAQLVARTLEQQPSPRILFPTGSTPLGEDGFFAQLARKRAQERLDTSKIRLVGGDEYYGVPKSDPGSFATYAMEKVVAPLGLNPAECLLLDGAAKDPQAECERFERSLRSDPLALAVLGLGTNGHVAFNDPPSLGSSLTRKLKLTKGSVESSAHDFPNRPYEELPTHALTIGMQTLQEVANVCVVMVCGAKKQDIVRKVLHETEYEGPEVPASQLRNARNFIFCLDSDASANLPASCRDRALIFTGETSHHAAEVMESAISKCRLDVSRLVANGDIGGTNARMQLWEVRESVGVPQHASESSSSSTNVLTIHPPLLRFDRRYKSKQFDGIEPLVRKFLQDAGVIVDGDSESSDLTRDRHVVDALALAICGPVVDETRSAGPVLPEQGPTGWGADVEDLVDKMNGVVKRAKLLNDFVAVGLGVPLMAANEDCILHLHTPGAQTETKSPTDDQSAHKNVSTMAAVGAGTGLGETYMTWNAQLQQYEAHASEGGMTEFCATTEELWEVRKFLQKRDGHVTVEGLVSGPGIANIYSYLVSKDGDDERETNVVRDVAKENQPATIAQLGISGVGDPRCREALRIFVTALAAHLRQTALHILPVGGLFLCGGIPPRIVPLLREMLSPGEFVKDPVMGDFIRENIPLSIILNDDLGLLGARVRAERMLARN